MPRMPAEPRKRACRCASPFLSWVISDQIEKRVKEDPDQIHEVPVESADLDGSIIGAVVSASARREGDDDPHYHADKNVERMQAGQKKIKAEEHLRRAGV